LAFLWTDFTVISRGYTPIKGFYTFSQSAHSPLLEEPEEVNRILMNDIKNLRVELADK
jgi:hypothetical protein